MKKLWTVFVAVAISVCLPLKAQLASLPLLNQAHQHMKPNKYTGIDAMLVYHQGQLVTERYYGRYNSETQHRVHSTFKSIATLITLIAIEQGLLSDNDAVMPLLARFRTLQNADPRKQKITVNHLLNMTSGLACNEAPNSDGPNHEFGIDEGQTPLAYAMEISMAFTPGQTFQYCNANSFLLTAAVSAALNKANRENIFEFAHKYLMQPLGITNYRFTKSYSGQFLNGQGNGYFLPKDLAKFGLLLLNNGQWQGETLISRASINRLFKPVAQINWSFVDLVNGMVGTKSTYANQWYTTQFVVSNQTVNVTHSWGNGGQYIFVVPSLQSVIVFTGSNQGNFTKQKQAFDIMHKYVLPELIQAESST